jgi:hypothetical protein
MALKRASASSKKKASWGVPKPLPIVALLVGLALSVYNLSLMTTQAGTLSGVSQSFQELQANYASRTTPQPRPPSERAVETPAPPVVFSVVMFRDGEEASLRTNLAEPLAAFYQEMRSPAALSAALIERKNASSKDVSVRLFFADGKERAFLWPSSNSQDGRWVPPCAGDPAAPAAGLPACPPRFSALYPDLVALAR